MRVVNLEVRGIKKWDHCGVGVSPLLAIQGPNGSGKSALLQAIRLALLGYDPDTGKRLQETRKIVGELGEADIRLSFDTGFRIRRRFGDRTKTEVDPSEGETTETAAQERIDRETGGLTIALDLREFLSWSPEKRRDWLFDHLPAESVDLDGSTFANWAGPGSDVLGRTVEDLWNNTIAPAANPVVGLGEALGIVHQDFLSADKARKDQEAAVASMSSHQIPAEGPPSPDAIKELRADVASLERRIGASREAEKARQRGLERIEGLQDEVRTAEARIRHAEDMKAEAEEALANIQDRVPARSEEELKGEETEAGERIARGERKLTPLVEEHAHLQVKLKDDERRLKAMEGGGCPYAALGCQTDLSATADALRPMIEEGLERLAKVRGRIAEAREQLEQDRARQQETRQHLQVLANIRGEESQLREKIRHAETLIAEFGDRKTAAEGNLNDLQEEAGAEGVGVSALVEERSRLLQEIEELEGKRSNAARAEAERETYRKAEQDLRRKVARANALKELRKNLRALRAHVIQQMIRPLHQQADEILREADPHKRWRFVFEHENRDAMDFGFEEDGVLRLFDAASTGERAILSIVLTAAFLAVLNPPFRLLMVDNLEAIDEGRRWKLQEVLRDLYERGLFDQVILAGVCDFEQEGWQVADVTNALETAELAASA